MTGDGSVPDDGGGDRTLDAGLSLLDRQIVAADGSPVGKVDDLEFSAAADGLYVTALLSGPTALGPRLGGRLGVWMVAVARRLTSGGDPTPRRIAVRDIRRITAAVELRTQPAPQRLEQWCAETIVDSIPRNRHASE